MSARSSGSDGLDASDTASLAPVYSIAARILLTELDREALEALNEERLLEVLETLRPGCRAYLRDTEWTSDALDDLAAAYCSLFILPGGVVPFAAHWLPGDAAVARDEFAVHVNEVLEALHVRPSDFGMGNMPTDHIGVLLALQSVAMERGSPADVERAGRLLQPWGPVFAAELTRRAAGMDAPIYEAAGRLVTELLAR